MAKLPETQIAVQLVGPDELILNRSKSVLTPGPHQIVMRSEAVGLCFSDMKVLKQFSQHARKSEILSGLDPAILAEVPTYVPGNAATVPGHEVVGEIVAVGAEVAHYKVGERFIVQADYRPYRTAASNGAFGYNFEGGLQEYVLLDERVVGNPDEPTGYMIRVDQTKGSSAVALVEPWACVESSYTTRDRRTLKAGGNLLVVADRRVTSQDMRDLMAAASPEGLPKPQYWASAETNEDLFPGKRITELAAIPDESFDDIVYYGNDADKLELLNDKLAKGGMINVVLDGNMIGRAVTIGVGRIHYGGTRWIGTIGSDASESYRMVPTTGEIRPHDRLIVIGAGGPMGQMHVIRAVSLGFDSLHVVAADVDDTRLESIVEKVRSIGKANDKFCHENMKRMPAQARFSYFALMAPIPALLDDAIQRAVPGSIVNLFAGIPAPVKHPVDLDQLIEKQVFIFGTSGSETEDMRVVLRKVLEGSLITNTSVGAVSGMAGAIDGLAAVEKRTMDGKIIVYPELHDVPLIPLEELEAVYPTVAAKLKDGQWTAEAETEFLAVAH